MSVGWIEAPIARVHPWADGLISVVFDYRLDDFEAGQFVNLGVDVEGRRTKRAYSLASAPGEDAEFFVVRVDDGVLTSRLFERTVGDTMLLLPKAAGFFTLRWVPDAEVLWMVGTGTGLAPFLSMLRAGDLFERFGHVVLVHGVRQAAHLAYQHEIMAHAEAHPGRVSYVPVVSREIAPGALRGRVTTAFDDGRLEEAAGRPLNAETGHVMMCGNPSMLDDLQALLEARRGMRVNRRKTPGHITVERYW